MLWKVYSACSEGYYVQCSVLCLQWSILCTVYCEGPSVEFLCYGKYKVPAVECYMHSVQLVAGQQKIFFGCHPKI